MSTYERVFSIPTSSRSLHRAKPGPRPACKTGRGRRAERLFIAAISIAEIERGIAKLRRKGGHQRAAGLSSRLDGIMLTFEDRVIAFDARAAKIAGVLADDAEARGHPPDLADVMIAATAKANAMTVVTDNLRHFETLDILVRLPAG